MGFAQDDAMEALVVTENKGIEGALEILFQQDKSVREKRWVVAVIVIVIDVVIVIVVGGGRFKSWGSPTRNQTRRRAEAFKKFGRPVVAPAVPASAQKDDVKEIEILERALDNEKNRRLKLEVWENIRILFCFCFLFFFFLSISCSNTSKPERV